MVMVGGGWLQTTDLYAWEAWAKGPHSLVSKGTLKDHLICLKVFYIMKAEASYASGRCVWRC